MKYIVSLCVLAMLVLSVVAPRTAAAASERCFAETGFCISGPIRAYWERNGGLAVFGYPITEQRTESVEGTWTGPTQWFERDRLEDHSAQGVMAGRLGARYLEVNGRPWTQGTEEPRPQRYPCRYFAETGYNLCPPFYDYWWSNGGLERFGYPISAAHEETIEGKTFLVQYFERRRMEYHPENAHTPFEIQLGLLGREVLNNASSGCHWPSDVLKRAGERVFGTLGCPSGANSGATLAAQQFEHGSMIWLVAPDGTARIFTITLDPPSGLQHWQEFTDTYREGEAVGGKDTLPAGRLAPVRGFGKLWWGNQAVREALGWAVTPETEEQGQFAEYKSFHAWIISQYSRNLSTILLPNGNVDFAGI